MACTKRWGALGTLWHAGQLPSRRLSNERHSWLEEMPLLLHQVGAARPPRLAQGPDALPMQALSSVPFLSMCRAYSKCCICRAASTSLLSTCDSSCMQAHSQRRVLQAPARLQGLEKQLFVQRCICESTRTRAVADACLAGALPPPRRGSDDEDEGDEEQGQGQEVDVALVLEIADDYKQARPARLPRCACWGPCAATFCRVQPAVRTAVTGAHCLGAQAQPVGLLCGAEGCAKHIPSWP